MKRILLLILTIFLFIPINGLAKEKDITLYLFSLDSCPHCQAEIKFLNEYLIDKENIHFVDYSLTNNSENRELYQKVQDYIGKESSSVPYLVIGNTTIIGFIPDTTEQTIKDAINYYLENDYCDYVGNVSGTNKTSCDIKENKGTNTNNNNYTLPILGKINAKNVSLPLVAMVVGFIDGFNPCAMWILLFLITMLIGTKDRKKMWILGTTFLLVSAITYLAFMKSWLNVANFINSISYIRIAIGLVGIIFGIINMKNFLHKNESGCEVVNDKKRNKIIDRIKKIIKQSNFVLALLGIALLAISVNLIELLCSLGLPVMFTQILSLNNLSKSMEWLYLLIYIFFFLLDDLIIFIIAMKTFKVTGISTRYTKYSHLIGGLILILIGILMIFKPGWLMFNF